MVRSVHFFLEESVSRQLNTKKARIPFSESRAGRRNKRESSSLDFTVYERNMVRSVQFSLEESVSP
ncbi:hypothetical protein AVEN_79265-1, partial [Araneus ventricosus]